MVKMNPSIWFPWKLGLFFLLFSFVLDVGRSDSETGSSSNSTSCFVFRREFEVENLSNEILQNEDVLLTIDTALLFTTNRIQNNCEDMKFFLGGASSTFLLSHYIESKCPSDSTNVWVNIPSIKANETITISMYYYCPPLSGIETSAKFSGSFFFMSDLNTCGPDRTMEKDSKLTDTFPTGGWVDEEFGTFIDEENVDHSHMLIGFSQDSDTNFHSYTYDTPNSHQRLTSYSTHRHIWVIETTIGSNLPPHFYITMCKSKSLNIHKNDILMYSDKDISVLDFERYVELDNLLPRIGDVPKVIGGSEFHYHDFHGVSYASSDVYNVYKHENEIYTVSGTNHIHTIIGNTSLSSNYPKEKLFSMLFGHVKSDATNLAIDDFIFLTSSFPPMGFEIIDELRGKFIIGADEYGLRYVNTSIMLNSSESENEINEDFTSHSHTYVPKFLPPEDDTVIIYPLSHLYSAEETHSHFEREEVSLLENVYLPQTKFAFVRRKKVEHISVRSIGIPVRLRDDYVLYTLPWEAIVFPIIGIILLLCVLVVVIIGVVIVFTLWKSSKNISREKIIENLVENAERDNEIELEKQKLEVEKEREMEENTKLREEISLLKEIHEGLGYSTGKTGKNESLKEMKLTNVLIGNMIQKMDNIICDVRIHEGTLKSTSEKVFVKVFPKDLFNIKAIKVFEIFENELFQYSHFSTHPNILAFKGYTRYPKSTIVLVIHEYSENVNLLSHLTKKKRTVIRFTEKVRIIYELALCLEYCHKVLQRPLKNLTLSSIYLNEKMKPKLDIPYSVIFSSDLKKSQFAAPELVLGKVPKEMYESEDEVLGMDDKEVKYKCDIYSLGVIMFCFLLETTNAYQNVKNTIKKKKPRSFKRIPFSFKKMKREKLNASKADDDEIGIRAANDELFRPKIEEKKKRFYPNWYINLMNQMMNHHPSYRPDCGRITSIISTIIGQTDERNKNDDQEEEKEEEEEEIEGKVEN